MAGLTLVQKQTLNDISKYEPAWRNFGLLTGQGFGDIMNGTIDKVETLETQVAVNIIGSKEVTVTNLSSNIIEIFDGTEEIFISDITIKVINIFNTFASISIGTDSNNELLFSSNESDLNEIIEYITFPKVTVSEPIKVYFTNGSSSSGAAKVIFNLR